MRLRSATGLVDAGGTWVRVAEADHGRLRNLQRYLSADFDTLEAVLEADRAAGRRPWSRLLVGVAAPITAQTIRMPNRGWSIDPGILQARLGLRRVHLYNDFEALAHALPGLGVADRVYLGGGQACAGSAQVVCGPGTGLGVACLLPQDGGWQVLASEGGHMDFAAVDAREQAIRRALAARYGHVSAERVLSGPGLVDLYQVLSGAGPNPPDAAAITQAARDGDRHAGQVLDVFFAALGSFAGNLALGFKAFGGVFLGGGILPQCLDLLKASAFRARFEAKGRYQAVMAGIPTAVITAREPVLLGLARIAERIGAN